ncbi:iron-containing alcohol dehydrogenase [Psittacicella gerlachiana]|uniref:Uncharacterized protein n=1 Tax=Psittacicella gerlachiana TaxID=2028574 RepID=A0A3A1YDY6_9GAMM|nr:iron-containing alcohol dehydrogenase [Psittacicella gerlachiana]RIY35875.1 hypothetical protein CKF59_03180 [Psittacicella gerlachiana]
MYNFSYYSPTRIEVGEGKETQIGQYLQKYAVRKALIVYGSERIKEDQTYAQVVESLTAQGIANVDFGGLEFASDLTKVQAAVNLVKSQEVDCIVTIGGTSVLDYGKVIAFASCTEEDFLSYANDEQQQITKALPIFAVMTFTSKGSVMNNLAVISGPQFKDKYVFEGEALIPQLAIINPKLQVSIPQAILIRSTISSIVFSLEGYLTAGDHPEFTDSIVENNIRTIMRTAQTLIEDPYNLRAHSEYAWASVLTANGITNFGVEDRLMPNFMLAFAVNEVLGLPFAECLTMVVPGWMDWWKDYKEPQFERFAQEIFGESEAIMGIEMLKIWFEKFNLPTQLPQLVEAEFTKLVEVAYAYACEWQAEEIYSYANLKEIFERAQGKNS